MVDPHCFSHEAILRQLERAEYAHGCYALRFYADVLNRPSAVPTDRIETFYLYPSGGTLRDKDHHLLFYDSRYDTYRGFKPPPPTTGTKSSS